MGFPNVLVKDKSGYTKREKGAVPFLKIVLTFTNRTNV